MLYELTSKFNFEFSEFNGTLFAFPLNSEFTETAITILKKLAIRLNKRVIFGKKTKSYAMFIETFQDDTIEGIILEIIKELGL